MFVLMDKVILVNKPTGMTSFDVVRDLRKIFHEKKIGHTGTLDPQASGLLIVLLGKYTKLLPFCVKNHKTYEATFRLGIDTDTQDIWGKVVNEKKPHLLSDEEISHIKEHFHGEMEQLPPMYSAKKVNGKKLYEYARDNLVLERKKEKIFIDELDLKHFKDDEYYLSATVSSGTYIRTLIHDIGAFVDEYATMTSLIRTSIEHLRLDDAYQLDEISADSEGIDPINVISDEYEIVEINNDKKIYNGVPVTIDNHRDKIIFVKDNKVLAAYERKDDGKYYCKRGLF